MIHGYRFLCCLAALLLCSCIGCQVVLDLGDPTLREGDAAVVDAAQSDASALDCTNQGPWWNSAFTRRRKLCIAGSRVSANVERLPVLVTLDPSRIDYAGAGDQGQALRFVTMDGTRLPHDIEVWQVDGTSLVWVQVPGIVAANDIGAEIWMYSGNVAASADERPAALWTSLDYESVHHLHDDFGDATGRGHDGTAYGGGPAPVAGRIGQGHLFDGVDDYLAPAGSTSFDFTRSLSIEVWIRVEQFTIEYQPVVAKGDDAWRLHRYGQDSVMALSMTDSNLVNTNVIMQNEVMPGQWLHLAAVYDGQEISLYFNGELDTMASYSATLHDSGYPIQIGHNEEKPSRFFNGVIDELRIAPVPRSQAYIQAAYRAMADPDFITFTDADESF